MYGRLAAGLGMQWHTRQSSSASSRVRGRSWIALGVAASWVISVRMRSTSALVAPWAREEALLVGVRRGLESGGVDAVPFVDLDEGGDAWGLGE